MTPPPKLSKYLMVVRAATKVKYSKTSQTDEEKQRERQRNEREAKKEEQDAINYKLHKEAREARLLDFEIRRQQEREKKREEQKIQHKQQQQQQQQQQHLQKQQEEQQQQQQGDLNLQSGGGPSDTINTTGLEAAETTTTTSVAAAATSTSETEPINSGPSNSGPPVKEVTPPDRSCPPAFRSRSVEREILYERKRYSAPEATSELKEPVSTPPSPQNITGPPPPPPPTHSVVAGPPATAAAATAAIIPILPLGVATLRDDSTESDQSVTCSQAQPDAYHRIM